MGQFTAEQSAAQPGNPVLSARRADAMERFLSAGLPSTAEEIWRYSRIDRFDLDRWSPARDEPAAGRIPPALAGLVESLAPLSAVVVVGNGWITHTDVAPSAAAVDLSVTSVDDGFRSATGRGLLVGDDLGPDPFLDLHDGFATDAVVVKIPAKQAVEHPIVVITWIEAHDGVAVFPRVLIDAGDESQATVVQLAASEDVAALAVPVTEIRVGQAAHVTSVSVQDYGRSVWQIGRVAARVEQDGNLRLHTSALGGDYARLRTDVVLAGRGAEAHLGATYFTSGTQMHDFRTLQDHVAPRTSSQLLFKGAVDDEASAVYSGLIRIHPDAAGSSAHQTNRNLTLSPTASAKSVPNLEILHNDVVCSHASAVGPVDDDQRFYLESRGVHPDDAERLIVSGFFTDAVSSLPISALRDHIGGRLAQRIEHRIEETA